MNSSPSSQPALLDHHPVSPFLDPRSLLISCSPTEPYPWLHHAFGMTYHLNSAPFLYLQRRHCRSQDIIFSRLLYPSPRAFHSNLKCHLFKHSYPDPSDHSPSPPERHPPNSYYVPSRYSGNRTWAFLDPPLGAPFDSSQRSWISWCPDALSFWVAL